MQKLNLVRMCPKWASGAQPGLWLKLPTSLPLHSHGGAKALLSLEMPSCLIGAAVSFIVLAVWHLY